MDIPEYLKTIAASSAILLPIIWALVTYYGQLGLTGRKQLISSLLTGLILGVLYQIAALGLPTAYSYWFVYVLYGLVLGLTASGVYETGKHLIAKNG